MPANPGPPPASAGEPSAAERPRERLLRHGAATLADTELVALVLGTGVAGESAVEIARRLLAGAGGPSGLQRADALALQSERGLGPARAAVLLAAFELGRRASAPPLPARPVLLAPEAVASLLGPLLRGRATEHLVVLSLDSRGALLAEPRPVEGGVRSVAARPADVLREPVILRASSVIVAHNHPSGDPGPSPQDIALTRVLVDAGRLLDIEVLDHVVIGLPGFVSMRREGLGFDRERRASAS